jgi:hypothetical protein
MATKLNGRMFISYRSSERKNISKLHKELRRAGIPTWLDSIDLDSGGEYTPEEIREQLRDENTAGFIAWVTQGYGNPKNDIIYNTELPEAARRWLPDKKNFAFIGICADGISYDEAAAELTGTGLVLTKMNYLRWGGSSHPKKKTMGEIAAIIRDKRLKRIHESRDQDAPITIKIHSGTDQGSDSEADFNIDISRTAGKELKKRPTQENWLKEVVIPSRKIVKAIHTIHRPIVIRGFLSTPGAFAMGAILYDFQDEITYLQHPIPSFPQVTPFRIGVQTKGEQIARVYQVPSSDIAPQDILIAFDVSFKTWQVLDHLSASGRDKAIRKGKNLIMVDFESYPNAFPDSEAIAATADLIMAEVNDIRGKGAHGNIHILGTLPSALAMELGRRLIGTPTQFIQTYDLDQATGVYEAVRLTRADIGV